MNTPPLAVRVQRKRLEALDICSFELVGIDAPVLPAFAAGSHIDVFLPNGLTRQYSLCNPAEERHRYVIGVLKDPASRGGSRAMHETVHEGDVLRVGPPRNQFALHEQATRSLLLAGGIGITPILCMAERLSRLDADFEMHYSARSRERMAFDGRIAQSGFADRVHRHFDDGAPAEKLDLPALLSDPDAGTHLYVCGPKGFIDAVLRTAREAGWPEARLHHEFFAAEPTTLAGDTAFELRLARSKRWIMVAPDQTATAALAAAGVPVPTSCEQGICGTCVTPVLQGTPDHRDQFLTAAEQAHNDRFTPCCSRAKSAFLVLDL
ncbi:PDR/VanB family oxidoreductase [Hydrogenophaga sp. OTU3427]|uniref:PDR/VanB family oxidoreductase n=1 Tax=Hydrogenophaga sp. OTU3427 TaxID=3043856 RepID=UPI00313E49FE